MATTKLSNREKYIQGKLKKKYGWCVKNHRTKDLYRTCTVLTNAYYERNRSELLEIVIYDVGLKDSIFERERDGSIIIHCYNDGVGVSSTSIDFEELELIYLAAKERRNSIARHLSEVK